MKWKGYVLQGILARDLQPMPNPSVKEQNGEYEVEGKCCIADLITWHEA